MDNKKPWFVARMKDIVIFHKIKVVTDNTKRKHTKDILKEKYITIGYKDAKGEILRMQLTPYHF